MTGIKLPTWPRLTGQFWPGSLSCWQVVNTADSIEILPPETPRGEMGCFVVVGLAALIGTQLFLYRQPDFPQAWLLTAWGIAMFLGFGVACLVLHVLFKREQARGPILLISFGKKEARLPRAGRSWPIDKVTRFDVVCGRSLRPKGRYDKPVKSPNPFVELQMVVDDAGEMTAWPLIGATGWSDPIVRGVAEKMGERMGLPVAMVNEDELVR